MSSWTDGGTSRQRKLTGRSPIMDQPVLVIDDDPFARKLIQFILTLNGAAVDEAENGSRGLALARSQHPSLVLLDLNLPDLDGKMVAHGIRSTCGTSVPILLMGSGKEVETAAQNLDVEGWLSKPISLDKVLEAVQHSFHDRKIA